MRICDIEGCERKHAAKGYCGKHYNMFRVHGDPLSAGYPSAGGTPEYITWQGMKTRCYSNKDKHYHRYGGRGIIVCDKWKHNFRAFLKDMGYKPFKGAQIDRIDNDGNYEPSNCRWVTAVENMRNRNNTVLSMEKAREIRKLYSTGNYKQSELAKLYNVNHGIISTVIHNKTWREIS